MCVFKPLEDVCGSSEKLFSGVENGIPRTLPVSSPEVGGHLLAGSSWLMRCCNIFVLVCFCKFHKWLTRPEFLVGDMLCVLGFSCFRYKFELWRCAEYSWVDVIVSIGFIHFPRCIVYSLERCSLFNSHTFSLRVGGFLFSLCFSCFTICVGVCFVCVQVVMRVSVVGLSVCCCLFCVCHCFAVVRLRFLWFCCFSMRLWWSLWSLCFLCYCLRAASLSLQLLFVFALVVVVVRVFVLRSLVVLILFGFCLA